MLWDGFEERERERERERISTAYSAAYVHGSERILFSFSLGGYSVERERLFSCGFLFSVRVVGDSLYV